MHGILKMLARVALGIAAAALVLSCAGTPRPAPKVLVKKERTVSFDTPVLVKETVAYPDGLVDTYTVYKYDDSLKRLLEKTTFDPTRPDPVERTVSEYDAAGILVDELNYGSNGSLRSRKDVTWTSEGLLATEKGTDAKGLGQYASNYSYDKAGRRVLWQAFDGSGILRATTSYAYDGQGRPLLIEIRNAAKALTGSIEIDYAAGGSTETRTYLASDGSVQGIEVSLYKDGELLRFERRHPDNSLIEATDYSYGSLGERLTAVLSDPTGKVKERRSYEYAIRKDQKVETYYE